MPSRDCRPHFRRPTIVLPPIKTRESDEALAKKLAVEIARIASSATSGEEAPVNPCSLAGVARRRFAAMPERDRTLAMQFARTLASTGDDEATEDRDDIEPALTALARRMARRHLNTIREDISVAIRDVADQARAQAMQITQTTVKMRPAGEIVVTPHRYTQTVYPPALTFHWETREPDAARAYWELRGPVTSTDPGPLLDRGFAENMFDDGRVGGEYTLYLNHYFPPVTPSPFQRYHMTVLPLGAPGAGLKLEAHYGHSAGRLTVGEPEPPAGVGAWSAPAVIDYGTEFRQPGTPFDFEEIPFYRKVRAKINWFKVDADQPGPGDEEYHLSAFITDISPMGATQLGTWGSYLPVTEGDTSRHTLGWNSLRVNLWSPVTSIWPRTQFVVLSVLEEDSGDGVDAWLAAMVELAAEALEGDLADEVRDYLREMQEELDEATDEFATALSDATAKYIAAFIGATVAGAIAAVIAYAIALIATFAAAGARDDFYGVEVIALTMGTNDARRINDGTALALSSSKILASGDLSGSEVGTRFETNEVEMQLTASGGPDGAGLGGIVRFGIQWEFSDRVTQTL